MTHVTRVSEAVHFTHHAPRYFGDCL